MWSATPWCSRLSRVSGRVCGSGCGAGSGWPSSQLFGLAQTAVAATLALLPERADGQRPEPLPKRQRLGAGVENYAVLEA